MKIFAGAALVIAAVALSPIAHAQQPNYINPTNPTPTTRVIPTPAPPPPPPKAPYNPYAGSNKQYSCYTSPDGKTSQCVAR